MQKRYFLKTCPNRVQFAHRFAKWSAVCPQVCPPALSFSSITMVNCTKIGQTCANCTQTIDVTMVKFAQNALKECSFARKYRVQFAQILPKIVQLSAVLPTIVQFATWFATYECSQSALRFAKMISKWQTYCTPLPWLPQWANCTKFLSNILTTCLLGISLKFLSCLKLICV